MTTTVEKTIDVDVPIRTAYNQWTQFEEFPEFMDGVEKVQQLDDKRLHWVADIGGVRREWDATIVDQVPDQRVAWAATSGATNAGAVFFTPSGPNRTRIMLTLEFEPEGFVENVGDKLGIIERRAEADLKRFKSFIENRGAETGAWRGEVQGSTVGAPGIEAAAQSKGDSGKAGMSGKAKIVGAAAVAAAGVAAAKAMKSDDDDKETYEVPAPYTPPAVDAGLTTDETYILVEDTTVDVYPTDMTDEALGTSTTERERNRNR